MIFVTVGTHEQQFNRLIKYIDELKKSQLVEDEIFIQTGFSTYTPKYCTWSKFYPYRNMMEFVHDARIVITHGGPSSFIMPLQEGKIPIVIPRQKQFGEHVNDHQLEFSRQVAKRQNNILVIEEIEDLRDTILNYDELASSMNVGLKSNNCLFNTKFSKIVEDLFHKRW